MGKTAKDNKYAKKSQGPKADKSWKRLKEAEKWKEGE